MGLEDGRGALRFSRASPALPAILPRFFAVGGSWVECGCDFVSGGDDGIPEADEVVPGCGKQV